MFKNSLKILVSLAFFQQVLLSFDNSSMNDTFNNTFLRANINDVVFPDQAASLQKKLGTLPSLGIVGRRDYDEQILLNGFPSNTLVNQVVSFEELSDTKTDCTFVRPLHPYFLKSENNRLEVFTRSTLPEVPVKITLVIAEWDYIHGTVFNEVQRMECTLCSFKDRNVKDGDSGIFSWESSLPKWAWQRGIFLDNNEETKRQLYQEVVEIHQILNDLSGVDPRDEQVETLGEKWKKSTDEFIQASEWRGKSYVFIDQLLEMSIKLALPGNDFGSISLKPLPEFDTLQMEFFGDGTLAVLRNEYGGALFDFISNLKDGPRGRPGDTRLSFDLWYRKNTDGQWEIDAFYPLHAPNTVSNYQMNFIDMEEMFLITNF